jgi:MgtC family
MTVGFVACPVLFPRPAQCPRQARRRPRSSSAAIPSASLASALARGRAAAIAAAAAALVSLPLPMLRTMAGAAQPAQAETSALVVGMAPSPPPLLDRDLSIPGWVLVAPSESNRVEVNGRQNEEADGGVRHGGARELFSPSPELELRVLKRLVVAMVVGGIIGVERRSAKSLAGIRTFCLVSLGAAIFMSTALIGFSTSDPVRASAAISTSVGFLGAGSLHQGRTYRRGMTTAAGIWLAAGKLYRICCRR